MTRYCPKCGEPVPSNCITCPKCYAKMPSEPPQQYREEKRETKHTDSNTLRLIMVIVPALFGFLGVWQIYRDYHRPFGYFMLLFGFVFFWLGNLLLFSLAPDIIVSIFKNFTAVGFLFLYIILFLITLADSVFDFHFSVRA